MSLATNSKAQKELKNRQEVRLLNQENDLRFVMSKPEGRRFLYWLIYDVCGLQNTMLGAQSSTLFEHEGRRSVGADLMLRVQEISAPEAIIMIREAIEAAVEDKQFLDSAKEVAKREDD